MAKLEDATVKVSVESMVHQALAELLQRIEAEHHLRVCNLSAVWVDVSSINGPSFKVGSLLIETASVPGGA